MSYAMPQGHRAFVRIVLVAGIVAFAATATVAFLSRDELVESGSAFGYSIGQSKEEVFQVIQREVELGNIDDFWSLQTRTFGLPLEFAEIANSEKWVVHLHSALLAFNYVELTFSNERLVSIYRRRQLLELP